ncbi:conserved exported hypothetical protein [Cupriavidus taiwanensis]|uniref:hypothetical protein n=1 Tax=Cupriavidus taiwanensis TaxID=164546 RepID=UPI000E19BB0B|nr:hypothetical protein [Cupriavidus taiwanensis]SPA25861.1 conserved exported hypothetical protein [Cupriavidus taiwanensis]
MDADKTGRRRWLDTTINLQNLFSAVLGAAVVVVLAWFALVGRVQALEAKDIEHDARFNRVDGDMRQQRQDVKEQLNGIGEDVKEIRRYLMDNAAGARPDIRRWAK